MENEKYLNLLESVISNYYDSKKTFAIQLGINPSSLSRILNDPETSVSDSFKNKVYEEIKSNPNIPEDIREYFITKSIEYIDAEISPRNENNKLTDEILRQLNLYDANFINSGSINESGRLRFVYGHLYEYLKSLNFRINMINADAVRREISILFNNLESLLLKNILSTNSKNQMLQHHFFYNVGLNIFELQESQKIYDFTHYVTMQNNSLSPYFLKEEMLFFSTKPSLSWNGNQISLIRKESELFKEETKNMRNLFGYRDPIGLFNIKHLGIIAPLVIICPPAPNYIIMKTYNNIFGEYIFNQEINSNKNIFCSHDDIEKGKVSFIGMLYKSNELSLKSGKHQQTEPNKNSIQLFNNYNGLNDKK